MQGAPNTNYEVIYGVSLLDDLHNYFPALLYDQGRFQTINSVFHYIRTQMSQRFNLFSYGANRWRAEEPEQVIFTFPPPAPVRTTPVPRTFNMQTTEETLVDTNLAATTLLLSLLGGGNLPRTTTTTTNTTAAQRWANFMNPVITRPTAAQIESNTELVTGLTDTSCAICQDTIRAEDMARRLRPCRHVYHQTCIDQWFERSVACPTCRHDIREAAPQQQPNE